MPLALRTTRQMGLILCFILLGVSLLITWNSPANNYETSIYKATPPLLWIALVSSFIIGMIEVLYCIYKKTSSWKIGFLLVFIVYIAFLSLWIIRGYPLWCAGDPLTHLGIIQDTLSSGHIERQNFYPITHIYLAQISSLLNFEPIIPHRYVPMFFGILFVPFMFIFANAVLPKKEQSILVALASTNFIHSWYLNLTPNHLSNLLLPIALFILIKTLDSTRNKLQWNLLLLIIVFLYPVFHPVPSLALLIVLATLGVPLMNLKISLGAFSTFSNNSRNKNNTVRFHYTTSLILLVWIITWISSFYVWDATIRNIYALISEGGESHLLKLMANINYAEGYGYSVTAQFLKVYGGIIIYGLLTLISWFILQGQNASKGKIVYFRLLSLYIPLALFILVMGLFYYLNIGFGPSRFEVYFIIICTIFVGFFLDAILSRAKHMHERSQYSTAKIFFTIPIVILLFSFLNGAAKLYPSPYILAANWQITRTEIAGMDWFLHNKIPENTISGISINPKRFADFLLEPEERRKIGALPFELTKDFIPPYHFGNISLGYYYNKTTYLILNEQDKKLYRDVFPKMAELRFTEEDFLKLESDYYVNKLYNNGGYDTYLIKPGFGGV